MALNVSSSFFTSLELELQFCTNTSGIGGPRDNACYSGILPTEVYPKFSVCNHRLSLINSIWLMFLRSPGETEGGGH